ncbi:PREDICTED: pentatricopeptide [Prunus dulcis]|uniref:PREDICTED: pentatricopeptide n=1 Tax=Prunus dulcis TaxID=3755 RepID=A0A5E4EVT7_PRUDU|nr:PREDICTED: pentatricopeptide [Prunus dulcis]
MLNQYLKTSIASMRGLYFINLFSFKNHSLSLCCSNANILGYVRSPIESISHVRTYLLSASSSYHLVPFLGTPCLNLVKLSQPLNALAAFRVSVRHFCSEIVTVDQSFDCDGRSGIEDESLESDVDKFCEAIMDNSNAYCNMEKALDQVGLPLTTSLVVGVLQRLRFEEKLAFRFFMWAGRRENYVHESLAYNDMIDILSCTRYKVKQFRIVCDLLDYMKRHNKSKVPVEVLLTILKQYTEKHLTYLQKFAKKKRIRVKTQPEINALNLLLDALCKCSLVQDAQDMLQRVKKKVKPDANTYNILFFGWCRVRNPTRGMKLLEEMIQVGHAPDNFTYTTAIDAFCKAGMVSEAAELFEFMRTQGSTISSPTAKTYAIMIVALVQNDRMEECFKLLGHMINSGCLPDVSTYKELLEGMCLAGKVEEAYKFLQEMGNKGLFGCNKVEDACCLLEDVVNKGMKLPYSKFDSFLMQLSVIGDLQSIHRLSGHMRQFYNPSMARRVALNQKRRSMSLRGS